MAFRIDGNGDPFKKNSLGKQHEVKDEAAVLPKPTVPVGQPHEVSNVQHIDIKDLQGLDALGYQNMGLHIRKPQNPVEELAAFMQSFSVADVPQDVKNSAMAVVGNVNIRFNEDVNRQKLMMAMARETVPEADQARIEQSVHEFEGLV